MASSSTISSSFVFFAVFLFLCTLSHATNPGLILTVVNNCPFTIWQPSSQTPATTSWSVAASPSTPSPTAPSPPLLTTGPAGSGLAPDAPTSTASSPASPATAAAARMQRLRWRRSRHSGPVHPPSRPERLLILRRQPRRWIQPSDDGDPTRREGVVPSGGLQGQSTGDVSGEAANVVPT
ncbi:hypothetical protein CK203_070504 [Vitis vinifera]|uniref:Uncharacterized protein n=1 Tax=Vitis vinifera TaxID=29760 RepID=A0A438FAS6_VITVI|nr:hypothetical protein CK203_070504 [Vitis vinifera]